MSNTRYDVGADSYNAAYSFPQVQFGNPELSAMESIGLPGSYDLSGEANSLEWPSQQLSRAYVSYGRSLNPYSQIETVNPTGPVYRSNQDIDTLPAAN